MLVCPNLLSDKNLLKIYFYACFRLKGISQKVKRYSVPVGKITKKQSEGVHQITVPCCQKYTPTDCFQRFFPLGYSIHEERTCVFQLFL